MKLCKSLVLFLMILQSTCGQLIRSNYIYEEIILNIHRYHNSSCIVLFHASLDSELTEDVITGTRLKDLQEYFSKLFIHTVILSIDTFALQIGINVYYLQRPLFVFLNDFDNIKMQFTDLITPWINMAYPNWLIFFRDETTIEHFFTDIHIPFDCKFMVSKRFMNLQDREIITEVYQIDRGTDIKQNIFASWNAKNGINLPRLTLYQRRNNLYGHPLRVISVEDPPSSVIIRNKKNEVIGLSGFFGTLIELLQEIMNFTIIYQVADEWGELMDNGTWTGAIGSLINKNSDILAAELLMTIQRLEVLKFTTPIYSTKCRTYIKKPENLLLWDKFIMPFTPGIWSTLGIITLATTCSILTIKHFISRHVPTKVEETDNSSSFEIFFDVLGTLCAQGMVMSVIDSIRLVHFTIHLTAVVVVAAYSAALISSLAVTKFFIPFRSIEGLLKEGSYRFGIVNADYNFFQNSSDRIINKLFNRMLEEEMKLPTNYLDGLSRVCKEKKYAFMALDTAVSQLQQSLNCKLIALDTIAEISISLALRPDNPFRELISKNILLMRDGGILRRLLNSVWTYTGNEIESFWKVLEISDIFSLISVLIGTTVISIVLMYGEIIVSIVKRFRKRRQKRVLKRKRGKSERLPLPIQNDFIL